VGRAAQLGPRYAEMRSLLDAAQRCERQIALRAKTRKRRMANFEAALAGDVAALGHAVPRPPHRTPEASRRGCAEALRSRRAGRAPERK
jgi:hypothetical protein